MLKTSSHVRFWLRDYDKHRNRRIRLRRFCGGEGRRAEGMTPHRTPCRSSMPIKPGQAGICAWRCSPHIGHICAVSDVVRRWFERLGYKAMFAQCHRHRRQESSTRLLPWASSGGGARHLRTRAHRGASVWRGAADGRLRHRPHEPTLTIRRH